MSILRDHEVTVRLTPEDANALKATVKKTGRPDDVIVARCLAIGLPVINAELKAQVLPALPFKNPS